MFSLLVDVIDICNNPITFFFILPYKFFYNRLLLDFIIASIKTPRYKKFKKKYH